MSQTPSITCKCRKSESLYLNQNKKTTTTTVAMAGIVKQFEIVKNIYNSNRIQTGSYALMVDHCIDSSVVVVVCDVELNLI